MQWCENPHVLQGHIVERGEDTNQQTDLFHTKCVAGEWRLKFVIDSGSSTKLVEQSVAKKLQLPLTVTFAHLYQLSWFKREHEVTIYVQWLISFTIDDIYHYYV